MIGQKFGRLTVLSDAGRTNQQKKIWLCQCECGAQTRTTTTQLRRGVTQSCGCLQRESVRKKNYRHGMAYKHPLYNTWKSMRQRCHNPKHPGYKSWGGRGIKVCKRWNNFSQWLQDVGPRPTPEHTLDRINNNGNYEPNNVRWATRAQQVQNSRSTKLTRQDIADIKELRGCGVILATIAETYGVSISTVSAITRGITWKD